MKLFVILIALIAAAPVHAQVYKCTVNGKTQYAERPCAPDAKALSIQDKLTPERQREAQDVARREQILRLNGEIADLHQQAQQIRSSGYQKADQNRKQARCAQLLREAKDAKDESNKWIYHQGLINDAKRRQKEAEDAHFSECYGTN